MTTADFRAQARAVRAATQMKLMELRRNRRAASRYATAAPVDSDLCAETASAAVIDDAAAAPAPFAQDADLDAGAEAGIHEHFEAAPAMATDSVAAAPAAADGMTISSATADYIARAARPRAPVAAPAAPTPVHAAASEAAAPRAAVPSDLASLRDVGPGLVWLLERAGVSTLDDLRAADPDALSDRLGLVGRLIDVRALQARATR